VVRLSRLNLGKYKSYASTNQEISSWKVELCLTNLKFNIKFLEDKNLKFLKGGDKIQRSKTFLHKIENLPIVSFFCFPQIKGGSNGQLF